VGGEVAAGFVGVAAATGGEAGRVGTLAGGADPGGTDDPAAVPAEPVEAGGGVAAATSAVGDGV
jgi:hypothetical protein